MIDKHRWPQRVKGRQAASVAMIGHTAQDTIIWAGGPEVVMEKAGKDTELQQGKWPTNQVRWDFTWLFTMLLCRWRTWSPSRPRGGERTGAGYIH